MFLLTYTGTPPGSLLIRDYARARIIILTTTQSDRTISGCASSDAEIARIGEELPGQQGFVAIDLQRGDWRTVELSISR
jgi:hypothetical protein